MLPLVTHVVTAAAQARANRMALRPSRGNGAEEAAYVRVRVYAFGDHLSKKTGAGKLLKLPCDANVDMALIKGICARAAFGGSSTPTGSGDFSMMDDSLIHVYLLPDGEVVDAPDVIVDSDKLCVLVSPHGFTGDIQSYDEVHAAMHLAAAEVVTLDTSAPPSMLVSPISTLESAQLDTVCAVPAVPPPALSLEPSPCETARVADTPADMAAGAPNGADVLQLLDASIVPGGYSGGIEQPTDAAEPADGTATAAVGVGVSSDGLGAASGKRPPRRASQSVTRVKLRRAVRKLMLIQRFNGSTDTFSSVKTGGTGSRRQRIGKVMDAYIREQSNLYMYGEKRLALMGERDALPFGLLRPDSNGHVMWDVCTLVFVVHSALVVPPRIGFDLTLSPADEIFDYMSDGVFITDVGVSFATTFKENGVYVRDRKQVMMGYLTGWFFLDLLATFPVNWVTDHVAGSSSLSNVNQILRLLRLFKLFRILRLLKLFPKLLAVLETSVKINPAVLRFGRAIFVLIMMWHLVGCAYWYVVRMQYNGTADCPEELGRPPRTCFVNHCLCDVDFTRDLTRITVLNDTEAGFYDPNNLDIWLPAPFAANKPFLDQYFIAAYWAIVVTTSIGINIVPRDVTEYAFTSVMIVFGLIMYSMVIGAASSALGDLDTAGAQRREMLERVLAYMRGRAVPRFFQKIIIDYYNHHWASPAINDAVIDDLPASLRSKLGMIVNRDLVDRIPSFQLMNVDIYLRMVQRLTTVTYLPGEYIIKQGDTSDSLFFIKTGKVDAVLPNGITVFLSLLPGDFFGEHSLLHLTKRDSSFRAVDFVDALCMSMAEFTALYVSAPEFVREVQRVDKERVEQRLKCELLLAARTASEKEQATRTQTKRMASFARKLGVFGTISGSPQEGEGTAPVTTGSSVVSRAMTVAQAVGTASAAAMRQAHERLRAVSIPSTTYARIAQAVRARVARGRPAVTPLSVIQERGSSTHVVPRSILSRHVVTVASASPVRASALALAPPDAAGWQAPSIAISTPASEHADGSHLLQTSAWRAPESDAGRNAAAVAGRGAFVLGRAGPMQFGSTPTAAQVLP